MSITDHAIGVDRANDHIWVTDKMPDTEETWIGTGADILFIRHHSLADALAFYLQRYPETETIRIILNNEYHHIDVQKTMREVVVNHILTNLTPED